MSTTDAGAVSGATPSATGDDRLAELLHETAEHHGRFEAATPPHNWWDWYARYLSARLRGLAPVEADETADRYMKEVRGVVPR
jgi:hypothetical protein